VGGRGVAAFGLGPGQVEAQGRVAGKLAVQGLQQGQGGRVVPGFQQ